MTAAALTRLRQSAVGRRLVGGFGANLLGKVWISAVQIALIPALSHSWGAEGYGLWLMLTTIPSYVALGDAGLGAALGVEMTRAMTRGEPGTARAALHSAWVALCAISLVVALLAVGAMALWAMLDPRPGVGPFAMADLRVAVVLMVLYALASLQTNLLRGGFQATRRYAQGTLLNDLVVPLEGAAVIGIALAGGGVMAAAAALLGLRLVWLGLFIGVLSRLEPQLRPGWQAASRAALAPLVRPSGAAFVLTGANALGIQGVIVTLGWALGPAAAALFGTARMLTRVPLQATALLTRAALPELTRAQEAGNAPLTTRLTRLNLSLTLALMLPATALLSGFGPGLLSGLSGGTLRAGWPLFAGLSVAALLAATWTALATPITAMNRHGSFAGALLGAYALVALVPLWSDLLGVVTVAAVAAEAAVLARVLALRGMAR